MTSFEILVETENDYFELPSLVHVGIVGNLPTALLIGMYLRKKIKKKEFVVIRVKEIKTIIQGDKIIEK